jgi:hypothetical protein
MAEIVNINRARKARERKRAEQRAAENRARFGMTKDARRRAEREIEKAKKELDDKRLE